MTPSKKRPEPRRFEVPVVYSDEPIAGHVTRNPTIKLEREDAETLWRLTQGFEAVGVACPNPYAKHWSAAQAVIALLRIVKEEAEATKGRVETKKSKG